jgi:hypothetical protein
MSNTQTPRTDAAETNWWSEDGLRSAFIVRAEFARELERENATLTAERDEARRSCCEFAAMVDSADTVLMYVDSNRFHEIAMRYMKSRGWDCFKEDGK